MDTRPRVVEPVRGRLIGPNTTTILLSLPPARCARDESDRRAAMQRRRTKSFRDNKIIIIVRYNHVISLSLLSRRTSSCRPRVPGKMSGRKIGHTQLFGWVCLGFSNRSKTTVLKFFFSTNRQHRMF